MYLCIYIFIYIIIFAYIYIYPTKMQKKIYEKRAQPTNGFQKLWFLTKRCFLAPFVCIMYIYVYILCI